MADTDDTQAEGNEDAPTADELAAARAILARAQGKTPPAANKPSDDKKDDDTPDDEEEDDLSAEAEAGASDTVPRSEMLKAIKARQKAKAALRESQQKLADLQRQNETEGEAKTREAAEKAAKAERDKYKPALVKTGATAALLAAKPKKGKEGIPRLIKLMDLDEIEVNDDLELEGVEEEVARLQEEFPELFGGDDETDTKEKDDKEETKTTRRRAPSSRSQDGAGKKPPAKKMSTSEIIMAKLRGDDIPTS